MSEASMNVRRMLVAPSLAIALACPTATIAEIKPEIVNDGKNATALVVLSGGRGFASCFCIDPSGYFLTNRHVVATGTDQPVKLVLHAGEAGEKTLDATVVRTDDALDLALLKAATD